MLRMRATLFFFFLPFLLQLAERVHFMHLIQKHIGIFENYYSIHQSGRCVSCFWLKVRTTCISTQFFFLLFSNNYVFMFLHSDRLQFWLKPNRFRKRNEIKKKKMKTKWCVCVESAKSTASIHKQIRNVANMHNNNNQ